MASSSHVNPGGTGKITAKVDTKGRIGPVSKGLQVFSNDPKRPVATLYLKAVIK